MDPPAIAASAGQEDAGLERAESTQGVTSRDDLESESYIWTTCSSNAYGAFIHVALQAGLWKALKLTLPMVLVSTLVQSGETIQCGLCVLVLNALMPIIRDDFVFCLSFFIPAVVVSLE